MRKDKSVQRASKVMGFDRRFIKIGDMVEVFGLTNPHTRKEKQKPIGEGIVTHLSGIYSHVKPLVWVDSIASCHHPKACRKKSLSEVIAENDYQF